MRGMLVRLPRKARRHNHCSETFRLCRQAVSYHLRLMNACSSSRKHDAKAGQAFCFVGNFGRQVGPLARSMEKVKSSARDGVAPSCLETQNIGFVIYHGGAPHPIYGNEARELPAGVWGKMEFQPLTAVIALRHPCFGSCSVEEIRHAYKSKVRVGASVVVPDASNSLMRGRLVEIYDSKALIRRKSFSFIYRPGDKVRLLNDVTVANRYLCSDDVGEVIEANEWERFSLPEGSVICKFASVPRVGLSPSQIEKVDKGQEEVPAASVCGGWPARAAILSYPVRLLASELEFMWPDGCSGCVIIKRNGVPVHPETGLGSLLKDPHALEVEVAGCDYPLELDFAASQAGRRAYKHDHRQALFRVVQTQFGGLVILFGLWIVLELRIAKRIQETNSSTTTMAVTKADSSTYRHPEPVESHGFGWTPVQYGFEPDSLGPIWCELTAQDTDDLREDGGADEADLEEDVSETDS